MDLNHLVILIVEDDFDARELMQAVLEQRGAKVIAADSVARAFELLPTTMPDVIISDIAMPEEDGLTFVRRLRAMPPDLGGETPAIAVSAYVANSDRTRALAAGFDRYLCKPIDFDDLTDAIQTVMGTKENKASA